MSYQIEPLRHRIWDERVSEIVELDVYGYRVVGTDGRQISEGATREEAMLAASEAILPNLAQV
ncbi:MAG: hypothetical protein Q7R79_03190 [bacterium]|nr:hypothetical protein [bacterium]